MTKDEKNLLEFLKKYPNQWHSYQTDHKTLKAVEGLHIQNGKLVLSRNTKQMYYNATFQD